MTSLALLLKGRWVQRAHEGWAAQSRREASSLMHWLQLVPELPANSFSEPKATMTHHLSALLPS